jgi:hypothetical protein
MLPLLLACGGAAALPEPATDLVFRGMCDASALWRAPDGDWWVADDESQVLRVYAPTGGEPKRTIDLGLGGSEADIEGSAEQGGLVWWIASHGRNKDAEPRPTRQILLATRPSGAPAGKLTTLLPALLAHPDLGPVLTAAEPLAPKKGGISIEGLAAADGGLWIGFRSPLDAEHHALAARLDAPEAVLAGGAPTIGAVAHLDLGGRGIRSMERIGSAWWIVAGSVGPGGAFQLYRWDGAAAPVAVAADLGELSPEALVGLPDGRLAVLSDDGTRPVGSRECKSAPKSERSFRARLLTLPP